MSLNSKYGLRNASNFLNSMRRKYAKETEDSNLMHNKTFIEEESLELYENPYRQVDKIQDPDAAKLKESAPVGELSEIKSIRKPTVTFCERLVVKKLKETLRTYQEDLEVLRENKEGLEEGIEVVGEKIRRLRELEGNNRFMASQNEKAREYLGELVKEYHLSLHLAFKSQLYQQELFNSLRSKVRMVLRELGEDYHYVGFVEHWNHHIATLSTHHQQIHRKLQEELLSQAEKAKGEVRNIKIIPAPAPQRERAGRLEEDQFLTPDEPKPKKKMSESQRASLLGDLKSFAKSFKFPNNP